MLVLTSLHCWECSLHWIDESSTVPCGLACRNWRNPRLKWQCHLSFGMLFERHDPNWSDVFAESNLVGFILLGCHLRGMSTHPTHIHTPMGIWHSVGAWEASLTRSLSDPSECILWCLRVHSLMFALCLSLFVLEMSLEDLSLGSRSGLLEI